MHIFNALYLNETVLIGLLQSHPIDSDNIRYKLNQTSLRIVLVRQKTIIIFRKKHPY